nr:hypothetical protein CFP56_09123 [Quercus suber]
MIRDSEGEIFDSLSVEERLPTGLDQAKLALSYGSECRLLANVFHPTACSAHFIQDLILCGKHTCSGRQHRQTPEEPPDVNMLVIACPASSR